MPEFLPAPAGKQADVKIELEKFELWILKFAIALFISGL
jgi:hypothetical protein